MKSGRTGTEASAVGEDEVAVVPALDEDVALDEPDAARRHQPLLHQRLVSLCEGQGGQRRPDQSKSARGLTRKTAQDRSERTLRP